MTSEISESEREAFDERIAATAIVNQAVLKCLVSGVRLTPDNVVFMIGDFFDPHRPQHAGLVLAILRAVEEVAVTLRRGQDLDG